MTGWNYPPQQAAPPARAVEEVLRRPKNAGHPALSRERVQRQPPMDGIIADGNTATPANKKA